MRKFHVFALALCAIFVFSAYAVASASALESVWLVGGHTALSLVLVDSEGELSLTDLNTPLGAATVLCSGLDEGWVGGDEKDGDNPKWDEVTKITGLNPATEPTSIKCTGQKVCEGTDAIATPLHLPWLTELLLETVGGVELYIDDITGTGGAAGWVLTECLVFGVKQAADTCENAGAQVEIVNLAAEVPPDVDAIFAEAIGTLATCTVGGANSGVVIGENLILAANGEALAVSEGDPTE